MSNSHRYPDPIVNPAKNLSVVTLNINQNPKMLQVLQEPVCRADIVVLTECQFESEEQFQHIASQSRSLRYEHLHHGGDVLLASRFPFVKHCGYDNVQGVMIDFGGRRIFVIGVHLGFGNPLHSCLFNEDRHREITRLIDRMVNLESENRPIVLVGDFNTLSGLDWPTWPECRRDQQVDDGLEWPIKRLYDIGFRDAGKDRVHQVTAHVDGEEPGSTWIEARETPEGFEHERIDYVFYRGGHSLYSQYKTIHLHNTSLSHWPTGDDHRGVRAVLNFP